MKSKTAKNSDNNGGQSKRKDLKNEIFSSWLGRRDSNPRIPGPKPGALPLGHSPSIGVNFICNVHGNRRCLPLLLVFARGAPDSA